MEKLRVEFKEIRDGSRYYYRQVERYFIKEDCEIAIYAVAHSEEALDKFPYFEGFKVTLKPKLKYENGKFIVTDTLYEYYPKESQFGTIAFTSPKIEILKDILNKRFNK